MIDADGLWLVQNEPDVIEGFSKAVLTPNVVEFGRLCKAMVSIMIISLSRMPQDMISWEDLLVSVFGHRVLSYSHENIADLSNLAYRTSAAWVLDHASAFQQIDPKDRSEEEVLKQLTSALKGPTILQKGKEDLISNGK